MADWSFKREKRCPCKVSISDPGKSRKACHSEGFYSEFDAMVEYWMFAITPNEPMWVWVTMPGGDVICNKHLQGKGLSLKDVPGEYHDAVAKSIADDIYACIDAAAEQDAMYRCNKKL